MVSLMRCQSPFVIPASFLLLAGALACSSSRSGRKSVVPNSDASNGADVVATDVSDTSEDVDIADTSVTEEDTSITDVADDVGIGDPDIAVDAEDTPKPDAGPPVLALQGGLLLIQVETSQVQNASISASIDTVPAPTAAPLQVEGPCQLLPDGSDLAMVG